jgi:hypothetical protein
MNHLTDDILLQRILELLDRDEEWRVSGHLSQCRECQMRFEKMKVDTELLGSLKLIADPPRLPQILYRRNFSSSFWKVAAILLIGFLGGWGSARLITPPPVEVVPLYENTNPPADSLTHFVVADAMACIRGS